MGIRTRTRELFLRIFSNKQRHEQLADWEKLYGCFDKTNYDSFRVNNLLSESGFCHGEIIKWASDLKPDCVLFVGENNTTATRLKKAINSKEVYTAGLSNSDYTWNFEKDAPLPKNKFDVIISQAIFEHLINPYKHLQDICTFLQGNGHIIIHTVMPGFHYHRYPIDAIRFYPDWFEESAKRMGLNVVNKRINDSHIFYMYKK